MSSLVMETALGDLPLFRRGKVRDTYELGELLLIVATDRISAFDVVLPTPIPSKGAVLTQLSRFWFEQIRDFVPTHFVTATFAEYPDVLKPYRAEIAGRSMLVRKAERIDVECVVRGYLAGSAWAEYRRDGTVAGERLPAGLRQADRLPEPIFTPAIKNDAGHDVNISNAELARLVGEDLARRLAETSLQIYRFAADLALRRGIIVADTKFEFGWIDGELAVIDELLTPDSSRFWDASIYDPGQDQPSFDKQFVRDWLIASGWNKEPPAPELPRDVVAGTAARYHEAFKRLTGTPLWLCTEDGAA